METIDGMGREDLLHHTEVYSLAHTASLVAETSWRPTEDVDHSAQGRPGTTLRLLTTEKGLGESL